MIPSYIIPQQTGALFDEIFLPGLKVESRDAAIRGIDAAARFLGTRPRLGRYHEDDIKHHDGIGPSDELSASTEDTQNQVQMSEVNNVKAASSDEARETCGEKEMKKRAEEEE